jgi:hypothetical protein
MVALAGNFYVFTPRLTALLAAVLLAVWNIAEAWSVRAFFVLLFFHGLLRSIVFWLLNSLTGARLEVQTLIADSFFFRSQLDGFGLFGAVAINQTCKIIRVDRIR